MEHQLIKIPNCPVCSSSNFEKFISAIDHNVSGDSFTIVKCLDCNFKFTNPIPTEDTIGNYYKSENYISHSDTNKGLINKIYQFVRKKAIKRKEQLISSEASGKHLLDIGCGTGDFLAYAKNKGWKVNGLEPDQDAREIAKQKNNLVVHDLSELNSFKDGFFDVITMWHVLEHVYHLNRDIEIFKSKLKPDGKLVVAVPNCSSYDANVYKEHWAAYDLPIHLYHFTPTDIKKLFSNHNMKLEKILPMYYDSYYISMLSEKYRGGSIFKAVINGFKSNREANKNGTTFSSQIYIISK